ncbi:MAG: 4-hydroxybutyrate CoA-transferase, partial [Clostridia bacterium]|nr:4-hydroxybutyrate CoA-transferase [Clostridia bacterium]
MDWRQEYRSKLLTVPEAAAQIKSFDRIWLSPTGAEPTGLVEALSARADQLEGVEVLSWLALSPYRFLTSPVYRGKINYHTFFFGGCEREYFSKGNVDIISLQFCKIEQALEAFAPQVLLADVSPPDADGYLYYGPFGVFLNSKAAELAERRIVQVNRRQPRVKGKAHKIHVSEVDCICEADSELPELVQSGISDAERQVAAYIVPRVKDGSCIQVGIGGLANAVAYGLADKKDLHVHTEMLTDSLAYLAQKGVVTGRMLAGFALGRRELYDYAEDGPVDFAPIYEVNNPYCIGGHDHFVSINACLMADLTGQVCSESLGFRQYSCTGGQLDYVRGAALSRGGQSYI